MGGYIDIKRLNLDELMGVVNLYPWFAGARKELCVRMSHMGVDIMEESQCAEAAMYLPSRRILSDIRRASRTQVWKDCDVEEIIKSYIAEQNPQEEERQISKRRVYAGAGDYFSQEDYDKVRSADDNVFSRYALKARESKPVDMQAEPVFDVFTETLAQIYAEQGYYEQAKDIYSKLILAYPEKNAYFAALIQKIDELN
jgi:tetratricopeptide (TPR) repeat protein